jgi:photosystem II stability/assembly factor-like uncharacterized protein
MNSTAARRIAALWITVFLCACSDGGGGTSSSPPPGPAPTPLPSGLAIKGATKVEAGTPDSFTTSVTQPAGLTFAWDFGDGATGEGPAVDHTYATGGNFHVALTVSNAARQSVSAAFDLQAGHYGNVAGLQCSGDDSSGWCWQNVRVTGHALTAAQFLPKARAAWVIGRAGTLVRSVDAGDTWSLHTFHAALGDVLAVNLDTASDGLVLMRSGALERSTDGGKTWATLGAPGSSLANPSFAWNDGTKIVVTDDAATQTSTDGGASWISIPLRQVFMSGANCWSLGGSVQESPGCVATTPVTAPVGAPGGTLFFAGAGFGSDGHRIVALGKAQGGNVQSYVSSDGGATWTVNAVPLVAGGSLTLADNMHAWYLDSASNVYLSADGGRTYATGPVPPGLGAGANRAGLVDNTDALFYMWQGHLALTSDFGATWTTLASPEPLTAPETVASFHVNFWDGDSHAVVSYDGRYHVTHDGGATWTQVLGPDPLGSWSKVPPVPHAPAIAFGDAGHGALVMASGLVQATTDGGRTWSRGVIDLTQAEQGPVSLAFTSPTDAWMTLDGRLWQSTDGGASWSPSPPAESITGAIQTAWPDARHGWVASSTALRSTTDGGASWNDVSLGQGFMAGDQVGSIAFESPEVGVVAVLRTGGTHLLLTADGGASWAEKGSASATGFVTHTGASDFWLGGTAPSHSADHGLTWNAVAMPVDSKSVQLFGGQGSTLYGFDDLGRAFTSTDAGKTWANRTLSADIAVGAGFVLDPITAWTVTRNGGVLATATGAQ